MGGATGAGAVGGWSRTYSGEAVRHRDEIRRDHDDRGRVVVRADLGDHLHTAQFQRGGVPHHLRAGLRELDRCFEFRLGLDDARALLANRLRLHRHDLLHVRGQLDILHLQPLDLDAPRGWSRG